MIKKNLKFFTELIPNEKREIEVHLHNNVAKIKIEPPPNRLFESLSAHPIQRFAREYKDASFINFAYRNNLNYNTKKQSFGIDMFRNAKYDLVHQITDHNINEYVESVKKEEFQLYESYKIPEILFLGRSNCGKSSLLNSLTCSKIATPSKKQGKTQCANFYLQSFKLKPTSFLVDCPGFGYVDGSVELRKKFRYLIYSYINFGIRINHVLYLINSKYNLQKNDLEELYKLNEFDVQIQLVFTKFYMN
jgi:GTP-binding protein EngB required for normal cell division